MSNEQQSRFDYAEVMERLEGDRDLFVMLAEMFVTEAENYVAQIRAASAEGNAENLGREAHTIKGVLATFANSLGAGMAFAIEKAAREGRLADAQAGVEALCEEVQQMVVLLQAEIAKP